MIYHFYCEHKNTDMLIIINDLHFSNVVISNRGLFKKFTGVWTWLVSVLIFREGLRASQDLITWPIKFISWWTFWVADYFLNIGMLVFKQLHIHGRIQKKRILHFLTLVYWFHPMVYTYRLLNNAIPYTCTFIIYKII